MMDVYIIDVVCILCGIGKMGKGVLFGMYFEYFFVVVLSVLWEWNFLDIVDVDDVIWGVFVGMGL